MDQRPSNEQPTLPAAVLASAVLVAAGLLLASLADDKATGETWLYRYQGLITGVLAIGAAVATIGQMRRSDQRSDERHQEVVELSIRADRLAMERALDPQIDDIEAVGDAAKHMVDDFVRSADAGEDEWPPHLAKWWHQFKSMFDFIVETIERPQFVAAERLFDGDLAFRVWFLRQQTEELLPHVEVAERYFSDRDPSLEDHREFENWRKDVAEALSHYVHFCERELPGIVAGLRRMGALYKVT